MNTAFITGAMTPDGSFAFTLTVVISGLSIVLGTLALLIVIFSNFGKAVAFFEAKNEKKKKKEESSLSFENVKKNEVPPPPPIIESGVSPEVAAVISAAVYMYEGEGAEIKSVRRKTAAYRGENPWAQAAVNDNTKPF